MNILLTTLNSKFTHSSLALRDIQGFLKQRGIQTTLVEYTINSNIFQIVGELYRLNPDIIVLSTYIWNVREMTYIATQLKKVLPNIIVIFGGPEVSYDVEAFMKGCPEADFVIQGEGEWTMSSLMQILTARLSYGAHKNLTNEQFDQLMDIPGLGFQVDGKYHFKPQSKHLPPLDEIPFPYDSFNELEHRILYYESSRGCPFNCTYCLSSATSGVRFLSDERWQSDLLTFLSAKVMQVKFIDRTFNANPDRALKIWHFIKANDNGVTNFHFEITASLLREEDHVFLKTLRPGLVQFEIGVQTTHEPTGIAINRPIPFEDLKRAVMPILTEQNIHVHLDLIAGLPFESFDRFLKSINDVFQLRPHMLQLGFLKIIKGSVLAQSIDQFHYLYEAAPPYEMMQNDFISYEEILLLKDVEEVIEHYYNSKLLPKSLCYIVSHAVNEAEGLLAFSMWLRQTGGFDQSNRQEKWAELLWLYAGVKGLASPQFRDYMIVEWMSTTGKNPPEFLSHGKDMKTEVFEWLKSEDFAKSFPNYSHVQPKEMIKKLRFTSIQYNLNKIVYNEYKLNCITDQKPSDQIVVVLIEQKHSVLETYSVIVI